MRKFLLLLCLVLWLPQQAAARKTELVEPPAIAVPAGLAHEDAVRAVKAALGHRGWTIESEKDGEIDAAYVASSHEARIALSIAAAAVTIKYVSSQNLDYKESDGQRYIRSNYNAWVASVADTISQYFAEGVPDPATLAASSEPGEPRSSQANPPPTEKFSNFGKFELARTVAGKDYTGADNSLADIDKRLGEAISPLLTDWESRGRGARVLRIEPTVEKIRFIGNAARIFIGGMAGHSWIVVRVRYVDAATNTTLAEPEFSARSGRGNGFTGAAADYRMLTAAVDAIVNYTSKNYGDAAGGGIGPPANLDSK